MISESVVDLSRFQFAMTAMYHFLFVPLTLGLAFILAIMETTYVISGKAKTVRLLGGNFSVKTILRFCAKINPSSS